MRIVLGLFFVLLIYAACNQAAAPDQAQTPPISDTAQYALDQALLRHGSALIDTSRIAFDFRDRHYIAIRNGGRFQYERIWTDTVTKAITRDVLTNKGLTREVNGRVTPLSAKDSSAYANSVNSVIYFALLPYFLNDPAVRKTYLGKTTIKGIAYHKIGVTFGAENGGKDFQDQYIYWIRQDNFTLDYLAYNYIVDGGGARFRQAYNLRPVNGLLIADFINFKPKSDSRDVVRFDRLFESDSLEELSRIVLENVAVD